MLAVVEERAAAGIAAALDRRGHPRPGSAGTVRTGATEGDGFEQGAKGVDGGAVRLVGAYARLTEHGPARSARAALTRRARRSAATDE